MRRRRAEKVETLGRAMLSVRMLEAPHIGDTAAEVGARCAPSPRARPATDKVHHYGGHHITPAIHLDLDVSPVARQHGL